jgi:hypothetical protein
MASTLISDGNGKSASKWFISLQIQYRPVAESLLMHECDGAGVVRRLGGGGRRWCRGQDQSSKAVKNIEKRCGTTFGEFQTCPDLRHICWCGWQKEGGTMQHVRLAAAGRLRSTVALELAAGKVWALPIAVQSARGIRRRNGTGSP